MPTPDHLTTDAKVAVLIAEGLEEIEALAVVDLLYRAGIAVDMLAVGDDIEVTSSHRITFRCDALLAAADLADYAPVLLPGGNPGTRNLKGTRAVTDEVTRRLESGLPLAAICAAPSIPAELGLLSGRRATANPAFIDALEKGGARVSRDSVVIDGDLLTSRGMATAVDLGLEIVRFLLDDDAVDALKKSVVYQR